MKIIATGARVRDTPGQLYVRGHDGRWHPAEISARQRIAKLPAWALWFYGVAATQF